MENDSKFWAFIGMLLGIVGLVLVLLFKKKDVYALHYAKQGSVLNIFAVIISLISVVPIFGWFIFIIGSVISTIWLIMGLVYSVSGEKRDIPVIGEFAKKIKL